MIAFELGVWMSANRNRALRVTGALLIGYGAFNIVALFFPLALSGNASVPMHIVATNSQLVLLLAAIGLGASAFHVGSACTRSSRRRRCLIHSCALRTDPRVGHW
jgi:hypothetical protein